MSKLYIVAGQSNAARLNKYQSLEEIIALNGLDAEVLHHAVGATSLAQDSSKVDWYPFEDGDENTGELLVGLIQSVHARLAENPNLEIGGIIWVQGERDASKGGHEDYLQNLQQLHDVLRSEFGEDFNFTVSGLTKSLPWYTGRVGQTNVSEAQSDFVGNNENSTLIDPDAVFDSIGHTSKEIKEDKIHINNLGADAVGYEFLQQFYDNLQTTYTKPGDDGSSVTHYLINGITYRTETYDANDTLMRFERFDWKGTKNWTKIEHVYDEQGVLSTWSKHFDNGTIKTRYFDENGQKFKLIHSDPNDAKNWESEETSFVEGIRSSSILTYDDGRARETYFDDSGKIESRYWEDTRDAKPWLHIEQTFDDNGKKDWQKVTYDDGRVAIIEYENGKKTSIVWQTADEAAAYDQPA